MLPGGLNLTNPFSKTVDQPIDGAPVVDGDAGYEAQDPDGDGVFDGYLITGLGKNAVTILTLTSGQ
jgi:hypothetical protein